MFASHIHTGEGNSLFSFWKFESHLILLISIFWDTNQCKNWDPLVKLLSQKSKDLKQKDTIILLIVATRFAFNSTCNITQVLTDLRLVMLKMVEREILKKCVSPKANSNRQMHPVIWPWLALHWYLVGEWLQLHRLFITQALSDKLGERS